MAHSRPTRVNNHGDGKRLSQGLGAFIVELIADRRVQDYYLDTWRQTRRNYDHLFETLQPFTQATLDTFLADVTAGDLAATRPFLATVVHIPERWLAVVTRALCLAFRTVYYAGRSTSENCLTPAPRWRGSPRFGVAVQLTPETARGKVPQYPDVIQRHMRWLYQHRFAVPTVPQRDLARDYASWAGRNTAGKESTAEERIRMCLSVVQNGIAQAEALLDLAAASTWNEDGVIVAAAKKVGPDEK